MALSPTVVSKPAHKVLKELTGETRPDLALSLALKDLVRLRLEAAEARIAAFEEKYGRDFAQFKEAWERGKIADSYSYPVEKEYPLNILGHPKILHSHTSTTDRSVLKKGRLVHF